MYFLHHQNTCKFLEQEFYSTALFCSSTGKMGFFSRQSISKTSERPTKQVSVLRDKVCLFRVFSPGVNYQMALGAGFSVPSMFHSQTHL